MHVEVRELMVACRLVAVPLEVVLDIVHHLPASLCNMLSCCRPFPSLLLEPVASCIIAHNCYHLDESVALSLRAPNIHTKFHVPQQTSSHLTFSQMIVTISAIVEPFLPESICVTDVCCLL